jgi:glycosyltransferase involved in cell wall biosynthesis
MLLRANLAWHSDVVEQSRLLLRIPSKSNTLNRRPQLPTISCILATKDRPGFLAQAIKYYRRQTMKDSELIVVDDSVQYHEPSPGRNSNIKYIFLKTPTSLGMKLNIGVEAASGTVIQKLDDDDYYHSRFLDETSSALNIAGSESIVALDRFLVLPLGSHTLYYSGPGWFAGGTLCFHRTAWRQTPFQDLPRRVDVSFLEDHPTLNRVRITNPVLYILVRHDANTWNEMVSETVVPTLTSEKEDVTAYFKRCEPYPKQLSQVVEADDYSFYETLSRQWNQRFDKTT